MTTEIEVLQFLHYHPLSKRADIGAALTTPVGDRTLKRIIAACVGKGFIEVVGRGPATAYRLTPQAQLTMPLDIDTYFLSEVDERTVQQSFNFDLIRDVIPSVALFSAEEISTLNNAQEVFRHRADQLTDTEYRKEMERLGIDLSWKSSQIEGNTYSLLETERLLKERREASGKTKEEAIMLLNHKAALDFILDNTDYLDHLTPARIVDIHALLTEDLGVDRDFRRHRVGITGTNYKPLDNEHQIRDAMDDTCQLINSKTGVFDKALLTLLLISYIQPFADGNKRTARIVSNAILIANDYCPISFRTVDSIDYKKAMLMFYEQNNIAAFKRIFIEQFIFATGAYF